MQERQIKGNGQVAIVETNNILDISEGQVCELYEQIKSIYSSIDPLWCRDSDSPYCEIIESNKQLYIVEFDPYTCFDALCNCISGAAIKRIEHITDVDAIKIQSSTKVLCIDDFGQDGTCTEYLITYKHYKIKRVYSEIS